MSYVHLTYLRYISLFGVLLLAGSSFHNFTVLFTYSKFSCWEFWEPPFLKSTSAVANQDHFST
jgi:hypothetical protein